MLKFLIDECLSPEIATEAKAVGIEAQHVNWLNRAGYPDRSLTPLVLASDYIFVTNNGVDFRPIYRSLDLRPGLVVVIPSVKRERQIALFMTVLARLRAEPDTVNKLIEIDVDGIVTISDFPPCRDNL